MAVLTPSRPAARNATSRDTMMVLGYTSWAGAAGRGRVHAEDRLTLELIASNRVPRLLVCNPFRSLPVKAARAAAGTSADPFPASPVRGLHEPLRLRRSDPTGLAAIERSCARYERSIRRAAQRLGLERPAVIVTHPLIAGFGDFDWAGPVTYYANDDLTAFPPLAPWWPAFEESFARMRAKRRRAVALTPKSLASVAPGGPAAIVPCGIEPDEWTRPAPAPRWFLDLPGPRLLYVGTLDERIDAEAVRALGRSCPDCSIVLVGPGGESGPLATLASLPNVQLRPPVARDELAGLVAAADAGLIPHVRSGQTEAMSPLKLYEYLAGGIPVAATDLPGISGVGPERVALASGSDDFAAAALAALALGRDDEAGRREFIAANSWSRRFEDLLDLALSSDPTSYSPSTSSGGL
jgi:teichuronic acid biosynthesis glycosyltransferase TuaH